MKEDFPFMTTLLTCLMISVFLFTMNIGERILNPEAEVNLSFYFEKFGFVPQRPTLYSLITYTFIHADIFHLFGNLMALTAVGLVLEKHIGKIPFLSIYISSGCLAAIFDIMNRILLKLPMSFPLIGSSGSIFGLMTVAALTQPTQKIPTLLVLLSLFPFIELILPFLIVQDVATFNAIFLLMVCVILLLNLIIPNSIPVGLAIFFFIFSWIFSLILRLPTSISNLAHLGGAVGGILSIFIFPKEKT